ncbi:MAG: MBL fold metallo-hydrolase [Desulfobacteraceae bacterium]|nr:MBL fold metallo-hydrolase [Desulfobacteraceae bacterium]
MTIIFILLGLLAASCTGILWIRLEQTNQRVKKELDQAGINRLAHPGTIKKLTLLPLVEYYANGPYATEAGVSYLIQADETMVLLDVGANEKKTHPSPLMSNIKRLGKDLSNLDAIVISHLHQDHLGGIREERQKNFSLSRGLVGLPKIPVYTPEKLSCSAHNPDPVPQLITRPLLIRQGIALTGPLPASLFFLGYTLEQALVFNVEKKGLVIVIGCGHPTIQIILDRAKKLFCEPIYAVIGGLHLPVKGGRMNLGPLNLQNLVGSNRMPWNCLNKKDVLKTIQIIQKESPKLVALSPHDSSDWAIDQFQQAFGPKYRAIEVGGPLKI